MFQNKQEVILSWVPFFRSSYPNIVLCERSVAARAALILQPRYPAMRAIQEKVCLQAHFLLTSEDLSWPDKGC